jgi:hypothetical protein
MGDVREAKLECSFCGKNPKEVKKLIAGPGTYICDECVGLCNDIIEEEVAKQRSEAPPQSNPDSVLARLSIIALNLHEITVILGRRCASAGVKADLLPGLAERVESLEAVLRAVQEVVLRHSHRRED